MTECEGEGLEGATYSCMKGRNTKRRRGEVCVFLPAQIKRKDKETGEERRLSGRECSPRTLFRGEGEEIYISAVAKRREGGRETVRKKVRPLPLAGMKEGKRTTWRFSY